MDRLNLGAIMTVKQSVKIGVQCACRTDRGRAVAAADAVAPAGSFPAWLAAPLPGQGTGSIAALEPVALEWAVADEFRILQPF